MTLAVAREKLPLLAGGSRMLRSGELYTRQCQEIQLSSFCALAFFVPLAKEIALETAKTAT